MVKKHQTKTHQTKTVKLIPEKQIFMHSCMTASVAFWGADARRNFDSTLLSATKDRTGDFKIYEQCFQKIVEENDGQIKDGFTEFNRFSEIVDIFEWLGDYIFDNRIKSSCIF